MNRELIKQKLVENKLILTYVGVAVGSFIVLTLCLTTVGVMVNSGNVKAQQQSELEVKVKSLESEAEKLKQSLQKAEQQVYKAEQEKQNLIKAVREELTRVNNLPDISCSDTTIGFETNNARGSWGFTVPKDKCVAYRRVLTLSDANLVNISTADRIFITDQVGVGANGIHINVPLAGFPANFNFKERSRTSVTTKDGFKVDLITKFNESTGFYILEANYSGAKSFSLSTDNLSKTKKDELEREITNILKSLDFNQG